MSDPLQTSAPESIQNVSNAPVDPHSSSNDINQNQSPKATATNGVSQAQPPLQLQPNHPIFNSALDSLIGMQMGSVTYPSSENCSLGSQSLNSIMTETAKPANCVPAFHCDVCNIVCSCQDALDQHKQGKKHQRNLLSIENLEKKQTLLQSGAPVSSLLFCTICNISCQTEAVFQTHLIGKKHASQVAKQASAAKPASMASMEVVEPANQTSKSVNCDLCQISCNSIEIMKAHLAGKKHLKNLKKSETAVSAVSTTPTGAMPMENPEDSKVEGENLQETESKANHVDTKVEHGNLQETESKVNPEDIKGKGGNLQERESKENPKDRKVEDGNLQESTENKIELPAIPEKDLNNKELQDTPSTWCELCKITCTSPELLNQHIQGKKHKKNLVKAEAERFIGPLVGPITPQLIGPTNNPGGIISAVAETKTPQKGAKRPHSGPDGDVETKKQKMLDGGAAPDTVRVCTICNVVCSGPANFMSHLGGRKHLELVKKATKARFPSVTV